MADFELIPPMATSKRSKNVVKPPTCRTLRLIGPKPIEEAEESSESNFDPDPQALALINNNLKLEQIKKTVKEMFVMVKMRIRLRRRRKGFRTFRFP